MKSSTNGHETLARAIAFSRIEARALVPKKISGGSARIHSFLKVVPEPIEIKRFKDKNELRIPARAHIFANCKVKQFDPEELVTHQRFVDKKHLYYFFDRPTLVATAIKHKWFTDELQGAGIEPIVVQCETGLHIYDGNHRATYNLLMGKLHTARFADLRWINDVDQKLIKHLKASGYNGTAHSIRLDRL